MCEIGGEVGDGMGTGSKQSEGSWAGGICSHGAARTLVRALEPAVRLPRLLAAAKLVGRTRQGSEKGWWERCTVDVVGWVPHY